MVETSLLREMLFNSSFPIVIFWVPSFRKGKSLEAVKYVSVFSSFTYYYSVKSCAEYDYRQEV